MTYIPATMMAALESAREIERARRQRFARPRRSAERAGAHHASRSREPGSSSG
jgi:hypothetical protein